MENTVNERLRFLMSELNIDTASFAKMLGVSDSTVRNYFDSKRNTKPGYDVLEKLYHSLERLSFSWLFTGEGEPFLAADTQTTQTGNFNQAGTSNKQTIKGNKGNIQTTTGNGNILNSFTLDDCKRDLEIAQREIEHLRSRLQDKEELLKSKDDTIKLLRATSDRPN